MGVMISRRALLAAPAFLAPARYNLLFLMSDQHQRRASSCYGHTQVRTPNIDRLANRGLRFESAYCPSPVCVPSRGSLITGLHPHTHGAKILDDALPSTSRTIAHYFAEKGYLTAAIGKMHFVDESRHHGFAHRLHEGDFTASLTDAQRQQVRDDHGDAGGINGSASELPIELFQDHWFAEQSVKFLHQNKAKPFCLWASFLQPHTPFRPHRDYFDKYVPEQMTLPRRPIGDLENGFPGNLVRAKERGWAQQSDDDARQSLAGYYGNVSQMDSYVGRVYDTLCELSLDKNTIVVYTSDHGEMAGAHRTWTKHNMYEESVGVPLVICIPDGPKGVRREIVEQIDLFPTLTQLCGLGSVKLPGRSQKALIEGQRHTPREFAYSEYYFCRKVFTKDDRYVGRPPLLMVRTAQYKLNYLSWDRCELFDVQKDPGEFANLIDDPTLSGVVRELKLIAERQFRL